MLSFSLYATNRLAFEEIIYKTIHKYLKQTYLHLRGRLF